MGDAVKIVVVGDGAVGKTSMLISLHTNSFPVDYTPGVYDNFVLRGQEIQQAGAPDVHLWDTPAQEDYDRLRPLYYFDTAVFVVCYSITSPVSLENVTSRWLPEIRTHCPAAPFLLVGTKCDVRTDESLQAEMHSLGRVLVDPLTARRLGDQLGASSMLECSGKTQEGLIDVVREALAVALAVRRGRPTRADQSRQQRQLDCCIL